MNILVVDDEKPAVEYLSRILTKIFDNDEAFIYMAQRTDAALKKATETVPDIAFLDIEMPGDDGLILAEKLKSINPLVEIIIVTAYLKYSLPALKIHVSDYILKPIDEAAVREALKNLQNTSKNRTKAVRIQCFGQFEIFHNDIPIRFGRSKSKEMLAYLICKRGAGVSSGELCTILWEDDENIIRKKTYIRQYFASLLKAFKDLSIDELLIHSQNSYAIDVNGIDCDYYDAINEKKVGDMAGKFGFMSQYSWAESEIIGWED